MNAASVRFLVGSYNRPGPYFQATGEGLAEYRLDPASGEIRRVTRIEGADNTTYLVAVPGGIVAAFDQANMQSRSGIGHRLAPALRRSSLEQLRRCHQPSRLFRFQANGKHSK